MRSSRAAIVEEVGVGALRVSLLFGSAAIALALVLTPILDRGTDDAVINLAGDLDPTTTGAVTPAATSNAPGRYTIRRSVLQASPNAVCVIRDNGARSGEC